MSGLEQLCRTGVESKLFGGKKKEATAAGDDEDDDEDF